MTKKVTLKIKPFVLIIRDGWGYNPNPDEDDYNAIKCAKTPVDDMLMLEYPNCLIHTSGEDVGLPDGTMGNSEVGPVSESIIRYLNRVGDLLFVLARSANASAGVPDQVWQGEDSKE